MNVELNKEFPLQHSSETSWQLLSDIEAVALCMPGAEITEVVDANNFKGSVRVKLGPVSMQFKGDIVVQSISANEKQIQLLASGQDNKGTSNASMDLTANIVDTSDSPSTLTGDAKVIVNGKMASFGQRMLAQVSDQILEKFADNFRAQLDLVQQSQPTDASDDTNAAHEVIDTAPQPQSTSSATGGSNEINGFAFILGTIKGLIADFFKRK